MDRLEAMALFVAAVDEASLAAAGRRLGHSPASVTRALSALEERIGAKLLHRTTRALRLTGAGEAYLVTCRRVLDEIERAELGAAVEQASPRGLLTLTAPVLFGRLGVRPVLEQFLDANPMVHARLLLLDRFVNLVEEGFDLAVRVGHLPDSNLVAVHIGDLRRVVCASPAYLARHGAPRTPGDLVGHACINASETAAQEPWSFAAAGGPSRKLRPTAIRPRLSVNNVAAAIDSAVEGRGITRAMSFQIKDQLAVGALVPLLVDYEPPKVPAHVLFAKQKATAKVRAFVDFAVQPLRAEFARAARIAATASADTPASD